MIESLPFSIYRESDLLHRIGEHKLFRPLNTTIIFINKGELSFHVNGQVNTYRGRQVVLISPRNSYEVLGASGDISLHVISLYSGFRHAIQFRFTLFEVYKLISFNHNNVLQVDSEAYDHFVLPILDALYYQQSLDIDRSYSREVSLNLFSALTYFLVDQLFLLARGDAKKHNSRKEELTFSFLEIASKEYIQEKELEYYADKLSVSVKYLSICVKDIAGIPPTQILARFLLEESKLRLANNGQKIAVIASDLGFSDQYSFSKFFKKNTGLSPVEFRKSIVGIHTI